jgi:hypothetical protein
VETGSERLRIFFNHPRSLLLTIKGAHPQWKMLLKYRDNVIYNLFSLLKKETHAGNILKPSK